jgi:flavin reductase (DIM6/NTAB) family NADH-FMN oxidoreductase RutF
VTTCQPNGQPRGLTASSFTSVSLDPPLLLVCIAKEALSCNTLENADYFAVNILASNQEEISSLFAAQSAEKFKITKWRANTQKIPLIEGTVANFSCARHRLVDGGDHLILMGEVLSFEVRQGTALGYDSG